MLEKLQDSSMEHNARMGYNEDEDEVGCDMSIIDKVWKINTLV